MAEPARQALPVDGKLRRRRDFVRCYRRGRRFRGRAVTLFVAPNDLGVARMGITASRKVGNAVVRNRTKRRIREVYRRWGHRSKLPSADLVIHVQPACATLEFAQLEEDLSRTLQRLVDARRGRSRP